jgi:hypothetical protein
VGLERGPLSLMRIIEELFEWKSSGSGQENRIKGREIRCADHATPSIGKSCRVDPFGLHPPLCEFNYDIHFTYPHIRLNVSPAGTCTGISEPLVYCQQKTDCSSVMARHRFHIDASMQSFMKSCLVIQITFPFPVI